MSWPALVKGEDCVGSACRVLRTLQAGASLGPSELPRREFLTGVRIYALPSVQIIEQLSPNTIAAMRWIHDDIVQRTGRSAQRHVVVVFKASVRVSKYVAIPLSGGAAACTPRRDRQRCARRYRRGRV